MKENTEDLGYRLFTLPLVMGLLGHETLRGHIAYQTNDAFGSILRWLDNPNKYKKEMIDKVYGGQDGYKSALQTMVSNTYGHFFGEKL